MATAATETVRVQRPLIDGPIHFRPAVQRASIIASPKPISFDPKKHLAYQPPERIYSMKDVGYPEDTGISPNAISEGFSLFPREAIEIMRAEIFSDEVWRDCLYVAGNSTALYIRGHCPKYTPFMHAALTHPETLRIVSSIAGIDLVPVMDYELGNILIASTPESALEQRRALGRSDEAAGKVTNWHKDHYPFVCVVMMSDVTGMVGGETAIQTESGEIRKIRGPQMGCATVMQGRHINHQALAAEGGGERISMVTSFRPRDPMLVDDSHLKYVTRIADPSELYYQFASYRLEMLEERIRRARIEMAVQREGGKVFDVPAGKKFLGEQMEHLRVTDEQIREYGEILSGKVYNGLEIRGEI